MTTAEHPTPTADQRDAELRAKALKLAYEFDQLQQRIPLDLAHVDQRTFLDVDPGTTIEIDGVRVPLPGIPHPEQEAA